MSRSNTLLRRVAIAGCALATAALVAVSGAPAKAMAAPSPHRHAARAPRSLAPTGQTGCKVISPIIGKSVFLICTDSGGPYLAVGNPAGGCVFPPAKVQGAQYCTPALLAFLLSP